MERYLVGRIHKDDSCEFEMLCWTTDAPTKEGWYWTDWGIVRVALETYPSGKKELVVYTAESGRMNEEPFSVDEYQKLLSHWLGPLLPPEPPNE